MIQFVITWLVVFILWIFSATRKPKNFPEGPAWLPILGSALTVKNARTKTGLLCKALEEISSDYKAHNGLLGLKIGKDLLVVALTGESLCEMMMNEAFDGRPKGPFYETRTWNSRRGVLLTDEDFWQEQRRFIIRNLKEFGFARRGMMEIIENEAEFLYEDFRDILQRGNGKAVIQMNDVFSMYVLNTLWVIMAGRRFTRDDVDQKRIQKLLTDLFASIDMVGAVFSHFPFLRFIAPVESGYLPFVKAHECFYKFFGHEVENHKKHFNINDEPRDIIDLYLKMIYSSSNPEIYTERQLLAVCLDMFIAGSETTTKSIGFSVLHIIKNQKIQYKMQEEIDRVVGDRRPRLADKINMPYCEAVALEGLRFFMGHTFGIPHRALKDTKLCGYDIPKDTMLIGSFRGMCFDESLWKDAKSFNPERFIQDGRVKVPEYFNPFGVGKRRCMGELMGRANIFLLITTLFQNFSITIPGNVELDEEPIDGATPSVKNYLAEFKFRLQATK